jgi:hypothetical protein
MQTGLENVKPKSLVEVNPKAGGLEGSCSVVLATRLMGPAA